MQFHFIYFRQKIKMATKTRPKRKLALVIGIGNYTDGRNLPNAINDAQDVTAALKRMNFIIKDAQLDLNYREMKLAITDFECSIERGDLVLFYFAGHGIQWEVCIAVVQINSTIVFIFNVFVEQKFSYSIKQSKY